MATSQAFELSIRADQQHDVLRRDQLQACGIGLPHLRAQLAAGRWQQLGTNVVILHNGPLTALQSQWVAVLHAGRGAALASRTAAQSAGLSGWPSDGTHVLVPRGRRVAPLPGVHLVVHESRRLRPADLHPTRTPPQTRVERSLIDAAAWTAHARHACGLLAAGVQQRLTTAQSLRQELGRAGSIRHRYQLLLALHDIEGGAQALSEIDFGRLCRRYGLPTPVRQVVRRDRTGRRRYVDATFVDRHGQVWHVEIDGGIHLRPTTYWQDMQRGNELVIARGRLLRFPTVAFRLDAEMVADQIRRALQLPAMRRAA